MIATRDRCSDLRRTCDRIRALQPPPNEVLICADGCSDGTVDMARTEFPDFVLLENLTALGSVRSRDRMLRLANSDVVLSLDDDSYPLAEDFFASLSKVFTAHPEAAVISFPELRDGDVFSCKSKTNQSKGHYVSAYANCAAAMRREFYLRQAGFPPFFVHMYEEPDYALQCYSARSAVWFEPSLVIRHHLSTVGRTHMRRHHQNARNELWSVWMRCPWPWAPLVSLFRVWRQFRYAYLEGFAWAVREPIWWFHAVAGAHRCVQARSPISWPRYYAWMRLARNPALSVSDGSIRELQSQPL